METNGPPQELEADSPLLTYRTLTLRLDVAEAVGGNVLGQSLRIEWDCGDGHEGAADYTEGGMPDSTVTLIGRILRGWLIGDAWLARSHASANGLTVVRD